MHSKLLLSKYISVSLLRVLILQNNGLSAYRLHAKRIYQRTRASLILAVGGIGNNSPLASTELYIPTITAWSPAGDLPIARGSFQIVLLPCGNVVAAGGIDDDGTLASAEMFNTITHSWSATGNLTTARGFSQMVALSGGDVLIAGGVDSHDTPLASAELYNSSTNVWSAASTLATARDSFQMLTLQDGNLLAAAGTDNTRPSNSEEHNCR